MNNGIQHYLKQAGVPSEVRESLDAYTVIDHGDGPSLENWNVEGVKKPTQEQIEEHAALAAAEAKENAYKDLRAAAYPNLKEQLDAIWKGGDDMENMRREVMAVKEKYPKP